jgi:hypothetical protein
MGFVTRHSVAISVSLGEPNDPTFRYDYRLIVQNLESVPLVGPVSITLTEDFSPFEAANQKCSLNVFAGGKRPIASQAACSGSLRTWRLSFPEFRTYDTWTFRLSTNAGSIRLELREPTVPNNPESVNEGQLLQRVELSGANGETVGWEGPRHFPTPTTFRTTAFVGPLVYLGVVLLMLLLYAPHKSISLGDWPLFPFGASVVALLPFISYRAFPLIRWPVYPAIQGYRNPVLTLPPVLPITRTPPLDHIM